MNFYKKKPDSKLNRANVIGKQVSINKEKLLKLYPKSPVALNIDLIPDNFIVEQYEYVFYLCDDSWKDSISKFVYFFIFQKIV